MTRALAVAADVGSGPDRFLTELLAPALMAAGREVASPYRRSLLGSWARTGLERVRLTEPSRADVAVLPFALEAVDAAPELWGVATRAAVEAERTGRVLLVFCHGDRYIPAPGPRCVMFRTHLDAAAAGPCDVAVPAWVSDPQATVPIPPRAYRTRPDIGFTGYAHPLGTGVGVAGWARFAVRCAATTAGVEDIVGLPACDPDRVLALLSLSRSRRVDLVSTLRSDMIRLDMNRPEDAAAHLELLAAVEGHDYGLAVRGLGNYSYRLYEVLAAGRRPLMVDSGAVLPRVQAVDWDRLAVRVPAARIASLGRRLAVAHAALDPTSWEQLQGECRTAWVEHLSVPGFFGHVVDRLLALLDGCPPERLRAEAIAAALR